jgi:hypothetical protein
MSGIEHDEEEEEEEEEGDCVAGSHPPGLTEGLARAGQKRSTGRKFVVNVRASARPAIYEKADSHGHHSSR